ncbi:MAG TPA: acyl-CoA dehydrogenase family protein [Acidimicrobiia bacterium]|nr:acyl-CoA dehydrogenase family protein [Acidimicrobiia bacterium]
MSDETPDLDEYRRAARDWLAANLEPASDDAMPRLRGTGHFTDEDVAAGRALQRKLYEAGYMGVTWPAEYGGQGLTPEHDRVFREEAAGYRMPNLGIAGGTTFGVCAATMLRHGSPEFLARHIPRILAGDELWVQFFSEPGAGSDLAGVTTRATRDGDRWILNGAKIWSSGAYYADYGMCLARTDWDVPKHRGLTWFAVPTRAPGVTVRPIKEINGDIEFCEEFFDDVELTDDDVIGGVNEGWTVAQTMLVLERGGGDVGLAALGGQGQGRRSQLPPHLVALARRVGREKDPVVRQQIARVHTMNFVQSQLVRRIAQHFRAGTGPPAGIAAYGKLASGTFDPERTRLAMEIGRGAALVWEEGDLDGQRASLNYLNGRIMSIAGGTNEMQRNAIGERVLGLPREPSFDTDKPFNEVVRNAANWTGKVG